MLGERRNRKSAQSKILSYPACATERSANIVAGYFLIYRPGYISQRVLKHSWSVFALASGGSPRRVVPLSSRPVRTTVVGQKSSDILLARSGGPSLEHDPAIFLAPTEGDRSKTRLTRHGREQPCQSSGTRAKGTSLITLPRWSVVESSITRDSFIQYTASILINKFV